MEKVTREIIIEVANKLMIRLTEEEIGSLINDFNNVIDQMLLIGIIPDIDNVTPMVFPFSVANDYLRDDTAKKPVSREDLLKNADDVEDGQIKLPKVIK